MKRARDDEAVAAIVAGPAQDRDVTVGQIVVGGFQCRHYLPAGVLHEHHRRYADLVDRLPIGIAHLGGIENAHG